MVIHLFEIVDAGVSPSSRSQQGNEQYCPPPYRPLPEEWGYMSPMESRQSLL
jgi:hypothetical protein